MQLLARSLFVKNNLCFKLIKLNVYFKLNNVPARFIGTKTYEQLTFKGLFCSHFPSTVDINEVLSKRQTIYAGFDATNESLHVGNLLVLISLFHLLHHGHKIIVLVGDATARIGDPSGKLVERKVLDDEIVDSNADGIETDIKQVFHNYKKYFVKREYSDKEFRILRNSSWYAQMNAIEFVNRYARQIRMGDMLSKSSIKERLQSPSGLSFAEFSYQIFQAYDWYYLFKKYGCRIQVGGIDQTVNIHNGYDMIKKIEQQLSCGLFIPLITDEKGNKIGKSEGKAIFLNAHLTSPFGLYQYFMRLRDKDINRFLKLFSFRSPEDIENMIQNQMKNPKPWQLQKKLAEEMTLLVHGEDGLEKARQLTKALFDKDLNRLGELNQKEIEDVFDSVPVHQFEFLPDQTMLEVAMKAQLFDSEINAIKTIRDGGFYVNYTRETEPSKVLEANQHVLKNGITIVSLGKRNYHLIKWL